MIQLLRNITAYRLDLLLLFTILMGASVNSSFAQKVEDPLVKPEIWARLQKQPTNDKYWRAYFGKDLFSLTKEEYKNYNTWKTYLEGEYQKLLEKREIVQQKKREEYYAKRWPTPPTEDDYEELSQNVYKNFSIIEQYFEEQFKRLGEAYEVYDKKYPEGKYNKIKWVEEHEEELELMQANY